MNRIRALPAIFIAAMFITCLLGIPVSAAPVTIDSYDKGDGWGVRQTMELDWKWDDMPEELKEEFGYILEDIGVDIERLEVLLDLEFYSLMEIIEKRESDYVADVQLAIKFKAGLGAAVSGDLPKAGIYDGDDLDAYFSMVPFAIQTENRQISVDLSVDLAILLEGTAVLRQDDLAIKNLDLSLKIAAVLDANGKGFPLSKDLMSGEDKVAIEYKDFNVKASAKLKGNVNLEFSSPLNLYKSTMDIYDEWNINSVATVTGDIEGFLDIRGLPDWIENDLFEEMADGLGFDFTSFPVNFKSFELGPLRVEDGKIDEQTFDLDYHVKVYDKDEIDGRTVLHLEASDNWSYESFEYIYTSDLVNIYTLSMLVDMIDDIDPDMLEEFGLNLSCKYMGLEEARDGIKNLSSYYDSVEGRSSLGFSLDLSDPIVIVVLSISVVTIIGGAGLLVIRRRM